MKPRHQVSRQAIELIKRFEGYRRSSASLPEGGWTIGYGHTKTARPGAEVSEKDAEALLIYDLLEVTKAVNDWTFTPLTQNQYDALVCFAANVGLENFRRSSVLRRVNEGAMLQAACALEMWRKAEFEGERIVVDALVRRRAAEKALFLTPTHGWVPAPSPVVRPRVDYDASSAQPKQRPLSLIVPMDGAEAAAHEAPVTVPAAPQDDEPSPAAAAADAVTARLQALVPDAPPEPSAESEAGLDLPSPPEPAFEAPRVEAEPQPIAAPAFVLTPPAEPVPVVEDEPMVAEVDAVVVDANAPPLPFEAPAEAPRDRSFAARADLPTREMAPDDFTFAANAAQAPEPSSTFEMDDAKPMTFDLAPLMALGAGGLVCFSFAIYWGFAAAPSTGGVLGPLSISWAAGILGIGCVVAAAYLLLEKLGGSEE